jgi:hypothetical protein
MKTNVVGWLVLIGCLALLIHGLRGAEKRNLWLLAWPLAALAFLLWQTPLFSQHVVLLAGADAVPAGVGFAHAIRDLRWRRRLAVAIAAAAALVGCIEAGIQPSQPEPAPIKKAIAIVRGASPTGSYVVATDEPIVAFLADRPVPPALVDTSWVRLLTGSLTRHELLATLRSDRVSAVLAGPRLLSSASARNTLRRLFPNHTQLASNSTLYLKAQAHR